MNRVTLNLATRPFRNNTVVGGILIGFAAAAIAASVYNVWIFTNYEGRYRELRQEEARHSDRLQGLDVEERKLSKEIVTRDFRRLKGRAQVASDLIMRRAFSWTLLFNKLESVIPAEVMMTAIRPHISGEGIVIRVEGIAKNHGGLMALEDALLKNPAFSRVYPASERRLNPSRPEITFVLQFDYLISKAVPGPDAIAGGADSAAPAASPAPEAQASPTPAVAAASPAPAGPAPSPAAGTPIAAAPGPPGSHLTVGRDGRPRTPEVMARLVIAPGGFYPDPPPPAAVPEPSATMKKSKSGRPHDARPAAAAPGAEAVPAAGPGKSPVPDGAAAGGGPDGVGATKASEGPANPRSVPPRQTSRPPVRPGPGGAAFRRDKLPRGTGPGQVEPIPATRLDMGLRFSSSAVGDVYAALSRAHGVRFELDSSIDKRAPLSADLAGKNLNEAIAVVSRLAGHRVVKVTDGVYRVASLAGGEPLADHPIQEESLPGDVKP